MGLKDSGLQFPVLEDASQPSRDHSLSAHCMSPSFRQGQVVVGSEETGGTWCEG